MVTALVPRGLQGRATALVLQGVGGGGQNSGPAKNDGVRPAHFLRVQLPEFRPYTYPGQLVQVSGFSLMLGNSWGNGVLFSP